MQNRPPEPESYFRPLEKFRLGDLEAVRLVLRGGSVIDWHRLNFGGRGRGASSSSRAQECDPDDPDDQARMEDLRDEAISYLRRNFDFPIPKPVASARHARALDARVGRRATASCARARS